MTDLRKAAEMALEAFDYHFDNEDDYLNWKYPLVLEAKQALRQALAQPKSEWVGLTDDEIAKADCVAMDYIGAGEYGLAEETIFDFAKAIEAKLKEKNTCCNHDCNEGRDCPFKKEKK
jgi:hypothetical protein